MSNWLRDSVDISREVTPRDAARGWHGRPGSLSNPLAALRDLSARFGVDDRRDGRRLERVDEQSNGWS
jgi:hypothetical protein